MGKAIFLTLIIINFNIVLAQENVNTLGMSPKKLSSKIEIFGGPAIVRMHSSTEYGKYGVLKFSYTVGMGVSQTINKHLNLNIKALYEVKGFKQTTTAFIPPDYYNDPPTTNLPPEKTEIKGDLDNHYISLIILPEYSVSKKHPIRLSAGPYLSQLIKTSITTTDVQGGVLKRRQVLSQSETYKDYDYGLSVFIGYTFASIKKLEFSLQVCYSYGLLNVVEMKPGLTSMKNNSLSFLFTVDFLR